MARKKTPKAKQFDSERVDDDDLDLPTGGGIPDDDGMIFLKTPNSKDATRGSKKKPLKSYRTTTDPWSVETLAGGVTRITFKLHLWVFVSSDWHWDSTHCDRERLAHDLGLAKKHHAAVLSLGDGFDAMGGKFDPRSTKHSIRPELQTDDYFDSCVTQCAEWLKPYKESLALITPGNHESAVRRDRRLA